MFGGAGVYAEGIDVRPSRRGHALSRGPTRRRNARSRPSGPSGPTATTGTARGSICPTGAFEHISTISRRGRWRRADVPRSAWPAVQLRPVRRKAAVDRSAASRIERRAGSGIDARSAAFSALRAGRLPGRGVQLDGARVCAKRFEGPRERSSNDPQHAARAGVGRRGRCIGSSRCWCSGSSARAVDGGPRRVINSTI